MSIPVVDGASLSYHRTVGSQTTLVKAHTVVLGTGGLYVGVASWVTPTITATYGGVPMIEIGTTQFVWMRVTWFRLMSPTVGTANIVLTPSSSTYMALGAFNVSGNDITTPTTAYAGAGGNNSTPTVSLTSSATELVLDLHGSWTASRVNTPGAGQTKLYGEDTPGDTDVHSAASIEDGSATTTMSWNSDPNDWILGAISIPQAADAAYLRVSQEVVETVGLPSPTGRISQVVLETITTTGPSASLRVSQTVVEVITPAPVGVTLRALVWMGDNGGTVWIE